jgi:hypothetical protein
MDTFIQDTSRAGSSRTVVNPKLDEEVREIVTGWVRRTINNSFLFPCNELYNIAQLVWDGVEEEGEGAVFYVYEDWSNFTGRTYNVMIKKVADAGSKWNGNCLNELVLMYINTLTPSAEYAFSKIKIIRVREEEEEEENAMWEAMYRDEDEDEEEE